MEAGRSEVQGYPWLHSECEASLGDVRLCAKRQINKNGSKIMFVEDAGFEPATEARCKERTPDSRLRDVHIPGVVGKAAEATGPSQRLSLILEPWKGIKDFSSSCGLHPGVSNQSFIWKETPELRWLTLYHEPPKDPSPTPQTPIYNSSSAITPPSHDRGGKRHLPTPFKGS